MATKTPISVVDSILESYIKPKNSIDRVKEDSQNVWKASHPKQPSKKEIWIGGYPSFYGGADTELDHNIDLWRAMGIEVNLVPMFGCDPKMRELCNERGCLTHEYHPRIFKDRIVASFCNGQFLDRLPEIMEQGKPAKVIWFNCMTWTFQKELVAHKNKWIDLFGFVSKYQLNYLKPLLEAVNPINILEDYKPYFNMKRVERIYNKPTDYFGVGRISRDDGAKYASDTWRIFDRVLTPIHKKVFMLGVGDNAKKKIGEPPNGLDYLTLSPGTWTQQEFYSTVHCVIHKTGGSRESYCRIVPECYAYGVPIIAEDEYAFPEIVEHGVTGYRAKTSDEMSYYASLLAFDEDKRKKIISSALFNLEHMTSNCERCWSRIYD